MDHIDWGYELERAPQRAGEREHCVCAAIRLKDGKVLKGKRHGECFTAAFDLALDHINAEQGFMTTFGRFVDRREGRKLQGAAGIASVAEGGYRGDLLYSEDLY